MTQTTIILTKIRYRLYSLDRNHSVSVVYQGKDIGDSWTEMQIAQWLLNSWRNKYISKGSIDRIEPGVYYQPAWRPEIIQIVSIQRTRPVNNEIHYISEVISSGE